MIEALFAIVVFPFCIGLSLMYAGGAFDPDDPINDVLGGDSGPCK